MSKINYQTMDLAELNQLLVDKQSDLLIARRSHAAGDLANPMKLKQLKSEIARIKTAINVRLIDKIEEEEK